MNNVQKAYEKMLNEGKGKNTNEENNYDLTPIQKLEMLIKMVNEHIEWHKKND